MPDFSVKLDLVLKALSLSRGRLAAELGVDKSLVGRWVSGAVTPSAHNLSALTGFVAKKRDGFTMLDWERDPAALASLFGVSLPAPMAVLQEEPAAAGRGVEVHAPSLVAAARRETERRGRSYEGFYRTTHPSMARPGKCVYSLMLIQLCDGLMIGRHGGPGTECVGTLFLVMGQLYGMLVDQSDDTVLFLVLNGVSMPRIERMDGVVASNAKDGPQTPSAVPILLERISDLPDSNEEIESLYVRLKEETHRYIDPENLPADVRAHLLRDIGPAAVAAGMGEMILRLPITISWSRGDRAPRKES